MHRHIDEVPAEAIAPGVVQRVLMEATESKPPGLSAKHYTLTGGEITFNEELTEYQHYIISGLALVDGRIVNGDTAVFKPWRIRFEGPEYASPEHKIHHFGEGETRIITFAYKIPRPSYRWAKAVVKNMYEAPYRRYGSIWSTHVISEQEHAVSGALRMHALDVQTNPPGVNLSRHRNPAEAMYFLGGEGVAIADNVEYDVRAGSFTYTPEGGIHGIENPHSSLPLHYFVLEFIEHDKMWTEKGYIGDDWKPSWQWS